MQELHLCLSADQPPGLTYLTLSHCWVKEQFVTLLESNLLEFLQHIDENALTQTFRDAIHTTRMLGFQYIWIDSLCIKQGDNEDWEKECMNMAVVYGNSSLNIAAIDAEDGTEGLLYHDRPILSPCCKALITVPKAKSPAQIWDFMPYLFDELLYQDRHLAGRGWVFQEAELAPIMLRFGRDEISWHCREMLTCESFPKGFQGFIVGRNSMFTDLTPYDAERWRDLIHHYSCCELTYEKDKLVAISGLARIYGEKITSRYLAGVWEIDLLDNLTWTLNQRYTKRGTIKRPETYRAPSWSWPSVDGAAMFENNVVDRAWTRQYHVTVVDVSVTLVSEDLYGEISDDHLQLD